jgi:hypothetical protein
MIFSKIQVQFRIRIHNLELRIWILQKVSDPYGSESKTLICTYVFWYNSIDLKFLHL